MKSKGQLTKNWEHFCLIHFESESISLFFIFKKIRLYLLIVWSWWPPLLVGLWRLLFVGLWGCWGCCWWWTQPFVVDGLTWPVINNLKKCQKRLNVLLKPSFGYLLRKSAPDFYLHRVYVSYKVSVQYVSTFLPIFTR